MENANESQFMALRDGTLVPRSDLVPGPAWYVNADDVLIETCSGVGGAEFVAERITAKAARALGIDPADLPTGIAVEGW